MSTFHHINTYFCIQRCVPATTICSTNSTTPTPKMFWNENNPTPTTTTCPKRWASERYASTSLLTMYTQQHSVVIFAGRFKEIKSSLCCRLYWLDPVEVGVCSIVIVEHGLLGMHLFVTTYLVSIYETIPNYTFSHSYIKNRAQFWYKITLMKKMGKYRVLSKKHFHPFG